MKRALLIVSGALIVTTSLVGCGPSESEAAPIARETAAPARRPAAEPAVQERPAGSLTPALEAAPLDVDPAAIREAMAEPIAAGAEAEPHATVEGPGVSDETPGEIAIVPRDAPVDMGDGTLDRRTLLDGAISLLVPASFTEMGPVMLQTKYPSQNRPTLVLTNESGAVNVAVNFTSNRVKEKDLASAFNVIRAQLRNAYPTADWYGSELTAINGHSCFRLDFRTPAVDTQVRNIMVGTILEGRLLLISFNTTRELEDDWIPVGAEIVESLQLGR